MTSTKSLTLEEAITLYFIVEPYIPKAVDTITHYDACSAIFEAMSPDEFIACITILTATPRNRIIVEDALDYFISFVEGMKENNIISMQNLFKHIGFID